MTTEKIIVQRKKRLGESHYSVGIYIDGEFIVNTIKNNRQEIELAVGPHLLEVKQGYRSGKIEIEVKKGKTMTCVFSSTTLIYLLSALVLLAWLFSNLLPTNDNGAGLYLYIPALLVAAYTFTKGKNSYFVFKEPTEELSWLNGNV